MAEAYLRLVASRQTSERIYDRESHALDEMTSDLAAIEDSPDVQKHMLYSL